MWIARDLDGELYLYNSKPIKKDGYFVGEESLQINPKIYPNLTYEKSPMYVKLTNYYGHKQTKQK